MALVLARALSAETHLLHRWDGAPSSSAWDEPPTLTEFERSRAGESMKQYLESLEIGGVRVYGRLEAGDLVDVIVRVARDENFDLIVMGTHGRTGVAHLIYGSVAEHVIRLAPCPTLTVRAPDPPSARAAEKTEGSALHA